MKRFTLYTILWHGLFFGITTVDAQSLTSTEARTRLYQEQSREERSYTPPNNFSPTHKLTNSPQPQRGPLAPTPSQQVWVIDQNQSAQRHPYIWVVRNTQHSGQQPFLQVSRKQLVKNGDEKSDNDSKPAKKEEIEQFDRVVKDTQKLQGLFTLYRNKEKNKIYLEIKPEQLNKNYLATATLESGIGEAGIYSGMPLQDFLFYFNRVGNNLQFVVRNVNFRTNEGDPQARSRSRSFSDSVLYSISIKSIHPQRKTILIDLSELLLTDLAGLSSSLGVSSPSTENSYFGSAKAFPENMEIESVLNFSSIGDSHRAEEKIPLFATLPDQRGFTLRLHYSLSQLPQNNYQPRLADDRIGYFLTAYQDLSNDDRRDPFVRYINRWHLEKQDPKAAISPPKQPIVFWIDNAVPEQYRAAITEGVLMWNKAFEKAGFKNAIQVRQMPDKADFDPADIRYNTIRWINTVDGYFAMGPSRVNPLTGQILNATILVDASFVRALKSDYRRIVQPQTNTRTSLSAFMQNRLLCANGLEPRGNSIQKNADIQKPIKDFTQRLSKLAGEYDLCYGMEAANQFSLGTMAMSLLQNVPPSSEQIKDYIHQYLRLIIAHEVGHTLGLRHNFRGSTMLPPEQLNNKEITQNKGLVTSVMDYIPPNLAPQGIKQGDYFPTKVGPYDQWAIQYGYTPAPTDEKAFLAKIAGQSYKPELSYSTDEDVFDLDPTADAWDNSGDVLMYSQWQLDNSRLMWDRLNTRYPSKGDSYSDVSERFGTVLGNYFQNIYYTTKYIGGQSFYRVHAGDPHGRLPFQPVPIEKQRQALTIVQKYVFAEDAFNFSPELLNKLAPSRWRHWGSSPRIGRLDYPIHDLVLFMQSLVLSELLSGDRLGRLKDIELKSQQDEALTLPELFNTLQSGIWTEVLKPKGDLIKISSLRRGLQREYLDILTGMVLRQEKVPEDARTLAWYKLRQLSEKLEQARSNDEYTKAHLLETRDRINKTLNAPLQGK
ncbi:zinc-dependent metalloprotease [Iningainema tapete]|uniref:Zinc-dependent metalloprotease n=1 Tax=Iningainema tapete BLCC-T55 TaxID=2748662 RepID=A0A8J7CHT4_9CYAN|nr:zinc-dependent metalloprotease [Iningainema tapete]MBD2778080.1 zinc-dependent metalloprotease [Iningainema tapete BLCC-T55]